MHCAIFVLIIAACSALVCAEAQPLFEFIQFVFNDVQAESLNATFNAAKARPNCLSMQALILTCNANAGAAARHTCFRNANRVLTELALCGLSNWRSNALSYAMPLLPPLLRPFLTTDVWNAFLIAFNQPLAATSLHALLHSYVTLPLPSKAKKLQIQFELAIKFVVQRSVAALKADERLGIIDYDLNMLRVQDVFEHATARLKYLRARSVDNALINDPESKWRYAEENLPTHVMVCYYLLYRSVFVSMAVEMIEHIARSYNKSQLIDTHDKLLYSLSILYGTIRSDQITNTAKSVSDAMSEIRASNTVKAEVFVPAFDAMLDKELIISADACTDVISITRTNNSKKSISSKDIKVLVTPKELFLAGKHLKIYDMDQLMKLVQFSEHSSPFESEWRNTCDNYSYTKLKEFPNCFQRTGSDLCVDLALRTFSTFKDLQKWREMRGADEGSAALGEYTIEKASKEADTVQTPPVSSKDSSELLENLASEQYAASVHPQKARASADTDDAKWLKPEEQAHTNSKINTEAHTAQPEQEVYKVQSKQEGHKAHINKKVYKAKLKKEATKLQSELFGVLHHKPSSACSSRSKLKSKKHILWICLGVVGAVLLAAVLSFILLRRKRKTLNSVYM